MQHPQLTWGAGLADAPADPWLQAKDAISLAMKDATPEVPGVAPEASTPEKEAAEKGGRRYGQRERTQVVLYSPGREGLHMTGAAKPACTKPAKEVRVHVCRC